MQLNANNTICICLLGNIVDLNVLFCEITAYSRIYYEDTFIISYFVGWNNTMYSVPEAFEIDVSAGLEIDEIVM